MAVATSIVKALRSASKGLLYTSESDAKITPFAWSTEEVAGATTPVEAVAKVAGVSASKIQTVSLDSFFDSMTSPQDWWGDEEKATAARFQELAKELSGLKNVAAFRVGDGPDIDVYIVGGDPASAGGFAGVKTRVTET
ncbi:MAG: nuclease A inhibitor family protein [Armatimonas sp.]